MNAVLYEEKDTDPQEYNAQYYVRKLNEYAERFSDFFEPEDFRNIFSSDEGSLFETSVEGIEMKVTEVAGGDAKVEEEEDE